MSFFKILPEEITLDIISRLPIKSVLDCKFVCTTWNNLLRHPSFSKLHDSGHLIHPSDSAADSGKLGFLAFSCSKNYFWYFEYDENHDQSKPPVHRITRVKLTLPFTNVELLGSCNGLIILSRSPNKRAALLCICNPVTRESFLLPEIKSDRDSGYNGNTYWTNGFGYVSSTNEYKVVRMMLESNCVNVYIYSLGRSIGWKNLGNFNLGCRSHIYEQPGVFANGALHWLDRRLNMIVAFGLEEEKFREHILPPCLPPYISSESNCIGVVDGYLYFAMYGLFRDETIYYNIWLFNKKNDNHYMEGQEERQSLAWSKEFRVRKSKLLAFIKSNVVLTYNFSSLNIDNTKTLTSKKLVEYKQHFRKIFPHRHTIVSLKKLGEEDTKIMDFVEVKGYIKP